MRMRSLLGALLGVLLLVSCTGEPISTEAAYAREVKRAMQATSQAREVFLGLELGIEKKEFYRRCTILNRKELITMGRGGNSVDHPLPTQLDRPAKLSFQPVFSEEDPPRVVAYRLDFIYDDWSPWNKAASAENLLPDVADYLAEQFPLNWWEIEHPVHKRTLVAVDGTTQFAIWTDLSNVYGRITDLTQVERDPLGIAK